MAQTNQPKQPDRRKTNVDPSVPPPLPDDEDTKEVQETRQRKHTERPERDLAETPGPETHDPVHPREPDARIGTN